MDDLDIDTIYHNVPEKIAMALLRVYDENDVVARDIAFHMTDWLTDLDEIRNLYLRIDSVTDEEITAMLFKFLSHVPSHLNAAAKLAGLGPVTDVFGVGIFEEDE